MRRKRRREPLGFANPVVANASGRDDQRRATRCAIDQCAERLNCLSQTHIIGQHTAHSPGTQASQPPVSIDLVVTQRRHEILWLVRCPIGERLETLQRLVPTRCCFQRHIRADQFLDGGDSGIRHFQRPTLGDDRVTELLQPAAKRVADPRELTVAHLHQRPVITNGRQ